MKKRHPQSIRDAAMQRFRENALTLAVHKELGLPYRTVYQWYREYLGKPIPRWKAKAREYFRQCALSSDAGES